MERAMYSTVSIAQSACLHDELKWGRMIRNNIFLLNDKEIPWGWGHGMKERERWWVCSLVVIELLKRLWDETITLAAVESVQCWWTRTQHIINDNMSWNIYHLKKEKNLMLPPCHLREQSHHSAVLPSAHLRTVQELPSHYLSNSSWCRLLLKPWCLKIPLL